MNKSVREPRLCALCWSGTLALKHQRSRVLHSKADMLLWSLTPKWCKNFKQNLSANFMLMSRAVSEIQSTKLSFLRVDFAAKTSFH